MDLSLFPMTVEFGRLPGLTEDGNRDVARMIARFIGAVLALFAFSVSVLAGLYVGNPVTVVLSRSILALIVFFLIGLALGAAAQAVVREHAKAREREQDRVELPAPPGSAAVRPTVASPSPGA